MLSMWYVRVWCETWDFLQQLEGETKAEISIYDNFSLEISTYGHFSLEEISTSEPFV